MVVKNQGLEATALDHYFREPHVQEREGFLDGINMCFFVFFGWITMVIGE